MMFDLTYKTTLQQQYTFYLFYILTSLGWTFLEHFERLNEYGNFVVFTWDLVWMGQSRYKGWTDTFILAENKLDAFLAKTEVSAKWFLQVLQVVARVHICPQRTLDEHIDLWYIHVTQNNLIVCISNFSHRFETCDNILFNWNII